MKRKKLFLCYFLIIVGATLVIPKDCSIHNKKDYCWIDCNPLGTNMGDE